MGLVSGTVPCGKGTEEACEESVKKHKAAIQLYAVLSCSPENFVRNGDFTWHKSVQY